jgi:murein DD-endopeptidase MepM/ murein hydrolase activator NlpD
MKKLTPLFGCALLCAPAPATAQTSGGTYASAPAAIEAVTCRSECVDEETARAGSVVRVVGRDMHRVRKVTFLGGRGDGDDKTVPVLRWSKRIADVRVPDGALSGRVRVRNGDGAPSRPSAETLPIGAEPAAPAPADRDVTAPAPAAPGAPDRDTSDRIDGAVDTATVFYAGYRKATLRYTVTGDAPLELAVELVRLPAGEQVARWAPGAVAPGVPQRIDWAGTAGGKPVPEGRYEFRVFPLAAAAAADGGGEAPIVTDSFRFLDHKFPVRGKHDFGGGQAVFGAGRPGHRHQGHDVFAECGTPMVAARGGVVRWKSSQGRAGNYVVIDGAGTDVDYAYMHLQQPAIVDKGDRVATGQRIGNVGDTGAASGCHLHFEMWSGPGWYEGGSPVDPLPFLRAWDRQSGAVTPAPAGTRAKPR